MKVNVEVTCTPEEARAFFGLPDIKPMQDRIMGEIEERLRSSLGAMNPETVFKTWLPASMQGMEQMQQMQQAFWSQLANIAIAARRNDTAMSQREKAVRSQALLRGPRLLLHQPPAGRPSARLLRGEGQRGVARLHEGPRQGSRPQERAHQQRRLPRPLRARAERGDLSRRRLVFLRRPRKTSTRCCRSTWSKGGRVERLMLQTADKLPKHRVKV